MKPISTVLILAALIAILLVGTAVLALAQVFMPPTQGGPSDTPPSIIGTPGQEGFGTPRDLVPLINNQPALGLIVSLATTPTLR
jgi:hypothetical protein